MKIFSFKRFFTFGMGMGKTASATSGFTGSVTSFVKDRWAATGWRFVAGGVGGGLAVFSLYLAAAIATGNAHAQTTVGVATTNTTVQGAAISLNSTYLNVTTPGAVTVTTPNLQLNGSEKISGNLTVQGYTTLSGPNTTIGAGSSTTNLNGYNTTINSTYTTVSSSQTFITGSKVELGANGATVNVKGQTTNLNAVDTKITGNLNASGPVSLAGGSITNPSFSSGSVAMGSGAVVANGATNAIQIGAGTNGTSNSISIGNATTNTLVSGSMQINNGLNMSGSTIQGVRADWANGNSAVNVNQLTSVRDNLRAEGVTAATAAAAATDQVQTNLAQETYERKAADGVQNTAIVDNKKAIQAESNRAMAAEAAISKEVRQVGAMAMAASAVGAATPVGDKTTAVSVAVGGYSGETAVAIGVTHMVKPNARIFGSISAVSRGKTGVAVGASFSF